jgi:hypothetical protein
MTSIISWKGKTLNQILTTVRKNENSTIITAENIHRSPPLKIYRKETNSNVKSKSSKLGITINSFEIPNGYTVPINGITNNSLITTMDVKVDGNENCGSGVCFSPQQNAKNRIRTSGIIKNNYNMDTKQYLQRRNISFEQNQYNYLQNGNAAVKPGSAASLLNTYATQSSNNTTNNCPPKQVVYKPSNSQFAQNGAVSSSSLLARKKYNTITSNAHEYLLPYGAAVADAMSYGISDSVFTYKNKLAFPTKKTPRFNKYTDTTTFCENVKTQR